MKLMAVPGRTFRLRGEHHESIPWILEIFTSSRFRLRSDRNEFPIRLRDGSRAMDFFVTSNEFGVLALASRRLRKKAFPQEVTIHFRGAEDGVHILRIETRARGGGSTMFVQKRFEGLMAKIIEEARRRGALADVGELTDSARE